MRTIQVKGTIRPDPTFRIKRGTYSLSVDLGDFDCTRTVPIQQSRVKADLLCQIK